MSTKLAAGMGKVAVNEIAQRRDLIVVEVTQREVGVKFRHTEGLCK